MKNKSKKAIIALATVISLSGVGFNSLQARADEGDYPTQINNWDWRAGIQQNPNQYWETTNNKPIIQRLNQKREITYYIDALPTNQYYKAWKYAVDQYNKLNVIKLVPSVKANAQIKLMSKYNAKKAADLSNYDTKPDIDGNNGMTYSTFDNNDGQNAYFTNSKCVLSVALGFYDSPTLYKLVAEHELGHALGFAHNNNTINGRYTVMNNGHDFLLAPKNKLPRPLGEYEKQQLINHYGPNPNDPNQKVS